MIADRNAARSETALLGRYRLGDTIAQGAINRVFLGTDERLWRPVCVKLFVWPDTNNQLWGMAYEHFVQEAYVLASLGHPNIVRIYDFGHAGIDDGDERPFQILEFLDGGSLVDVVRAERSIAIAEARSVIVGLAGALAEVHAQGVVHRDLKPQNVMFAGRSGRVAKLVDFGIAKSLDPTARGLPMPSIADDTLVGGVPIAMYSKHWAAPEQLLARPVDVTADVYSLGLVAAFLLTGQVVLSGGEDDLAIRRSIDVLLRAAFAKLEGGASIAALLGRACAFSACDRPREISAFAIELAEMLQRLEEHPQHEPDTSSTCVVGIRSGESLVVGSRHISMVPVRDGTIGLTCGRLGARVHARIASAGQERVVLSLRGQNCLIASPTARPALAMQITADREIVLVSTGQQCLGRARVRFPRPGTGTILDLEGVAIEALDATFAVALDFGHREICIVVCSDLATLARSS